MRLTIFNMPPPGEQFVFHQRDVGFDAGGVAVHEERDGAGRRQHGDLRVAIAMLPASLQRAVPAVARFFLQIIEFLARLNLLRRASRCSWMTPSMDSTLSFASGLATCAQRASR